MAGWIARRPRLSLAVALGVGFLASALLQWMPEQGRRLELTQVVEGVLTDPGSPAAGAANPQVTIVVFTDYQCAICKVTDPALTRLIESDPTVRVIWKDWPIRGPASSLAARTALAAHREGRYVQVHTALMAANGQLTPERIADIARAAGADPDLARRHAREIDAQLGRHTLQAFGLGVAGTPTYLVGPYLLEGGLDDYALSQAVERARRAGPPQPP
jgi:protein-disulfide isomerase